MTPYRAKPSRIASNMASACVSTYSHTGQTMTTCELDSRDWYGER